MRLTADQLVELMDRVSDLGTEAADMERRGEIEEVGMDLSLSFTGSLLLQYRVARAILEASGSTSPDLMLFMSGINIVLASFENALGEALEDAEADEYPTLPSMRALPGGPILN
jgi:hypothetical protein